MLLYLANISCRICHSSKQYTDLFIFIHEDSLFQNEGQQQQIVKETFQLVSKRDDNVCNFLEGGR